MFLGRLIGCSFLSLCLLQPSEERLPLRPSHRLPGRAGSPSGKYLGSSYVALSRTFTGSNTTRSAAYPGAIKPRLPNLNLLAGKEVIFLTASSRVSNCFSLTYLARACGKVP